MASNRTVGKALNSRGLSTNSAVIRIRTANVIEKARLASRSHVGMGRIITTRMATTPKASTISPRPVNIFIPACRLNLLPSTVVVSVDVSAMTV